MTPALRRLATRPDLGTDPSGIARTAVSGNLVAGVVAVTILVLLMRYIGLAWSGGRSRAADEVIA
jgi:hypothetical protein